MKNLIRLKNILTIVRLFSDEVFHNVFSSSFFKRKRNIFLILFILLCLYLGFYYLNMDSLSHINQHPSRDIKMIRLFLSSVTNLTIIIGGFIFELVDTTFGVNFSMIYLIKTLPFTDREISSAVKIFKIFIGLIIFELIFAVVIPAFSVIAIPLTNMMIIFLIEHILFILVFYIWNFISNGIIKKILPEILASTLVNIVIIIINTIYFFSWRFSIDNWASNSLWHISLSYLIITLLTVLVVSAFIILGLEYIFPFTDEVYIKRAFIKFFRITPISISVVTLAMIRVKRYLYLLGIIFLIGVAAFFQTNNLNTSVQAFIFIYPIFSTIGLSYADSIYLFKKMFSFVGMSWSKEFVYLNLTALFINIPVLLLVIIQTTNTNVLVVMLSLFIFNMSLLLGILFPKRSSSINETLSTILLIFTLGAIGMMINKFYYVASFYAISLITLILILRMEAKKYE